MIDFYKVLNIKNHLTSKYYIEKNYKLIKLSIEKDLGEGVINPKKFAEKNNQLEIAYKLLIDPIKRSNYDFAYELSKENKRLNKDMKALFKMSRILSDTELITGKQVKK